jgi:hypothetical protein
MLATIQFRNFCFLVCYIKTQNRDYLPVVLYGCETRSLILREEYTTRISENRLLRRIFGLKRDEILGAWRILHNEEFYNSATGYGLDN